MSKTEILDQEDRERQEEIIRLLTDLSGYGITLEDLVKVSPQKWKDIEQAKLLGLIVASDEAMRQDLIRDKMFPADRLQEVSQISLGVIKRLRPYITAVALLLNGDYKHLKEYILPWGKEWTNG